MNKEPFFPSCTSVKTFAVAQPVLNKASSRCQMRAEQNWRECIPPEAGPYLAGYSQVIHGVLMRPNEVSPVLRAGSSPFHALAFSVLYAPLLSCRHPGMLARASGRSC